DAGGDVAGGRAGGRQLLEPLKLPYAMIDVNDVVADLQVAEVGQEGRRLALLAGAPALCARDRRALALAEDVALGQHVEHGRRQGEAVCKLAYSDRARAGERRVGLALAPVE